MKRKKKIKLPAFPRVRPAIDTSSRVHVDKKTKSRGRRALNDPSNWE